MKYREVPPSSALAEHIECFWSLQSDRDATNPGPQRILPDGCVELVVNLADPFAERGPHGLALQPQYFVAGQIDRPLEIVATGGRRCWGLVFTPPGREEFRACR